MNNLSLKSQLDARQLAIVESELENRKKSMVVGYLLWLFLGEFGAHRFFTGRVVSGVIMLVVGLISWFFALIFLVFLGLGILFLIPIGLWWIIDAFLLHGYIQEENSKKERDILLKVLQRSDAPA